MGCRGAGRGRHRLVIESSTIQLGRDQGGASEPARASKPTGEGGEDEPNGEKSPEAVSKSAEVRFS